MALTFPSNPTNGQVYDQYIYNSSSQSWRVYGSDTGMTNVLATKASLSGGNSFSGNQEITSGTLTVSQQPTYAGSLNGVSSTSNFFPVATDNFNVGFSKSNNNRLTAQVAGKYYVYAQQLVNTSGGTYFHILKNGNSVAYAYSNNDDTYDVVVGALVSLAVNDYIEIYYGNTVSYSWPAPHSSYLVFKVS